MTVNNEKGKELRVINPIAPERERDRKPAERLDTLKGKTIGLLDNAKPRADVILRLVKAYLEEQGAVCSIYEFKPHLAKPLPEEQIERLSKADAVVGAIGDCGSCSTGLAKDGVALEQRGIPTATIFTPIFATSAAFNAAGQGLPTLPIAILPTPTGLAGDLPEEEIRAYTKPILEDIAAILTEKDIAKLERIYGADRYVEGARTEGDAPTIRLKKLPASEYENFDPEELIAVLEQNRAWDGLPVVAPTKERVDRFLAYSLHDPDDELLKVTPRNGILTPKRLAANAVLAGCKPEYYPILETAFKAMKSADFNLGGLTTTTGEVWPSIIVSGPYAEKIGMNAGFGLFGPGNRANITIGRAVTLTLFSVGGAFPGQGSFATFGNMTRRGLAFAEDSDSPWDTYNAEKGYPDRTTITVATTINPSLMVDESERAENILYLTARHIALPGTRGDYNPGEFIVVFNPSHRNRLMQNGWTKRDIKEYLYENARQPYAVLKNLGAQVNRKRWPKWVYGNPYDGSVPFLRSPEDAILLAGGGAVAAHTAIFSTWLGNSKTQTVPLEGESAF
ncbi:MAG: hypothetical protein LBD95_05415 [Clostridiales Family XIII bacterium]|nr:hypothetical protein [Clostridiales Family XIII bacterium]